MRLPSASSHACTACRLGGQAISAEWTPPALLAWAGDLTLVVSRMGAEGFQVLRLDSTGILAPCAAGPDEAFEQDGEHAQAQSAMVPCSASGAAVPAQPEVPPGLRVLPVPPGSRGGAGMGMAAWQQPAMLGAGAPVKGLALVGEPREQEFMLVTYGRERMLRCSEMHVALD